MKKVSLSIFCLTFASLLVTNGTCDTKKMFTKKSMKPYPLPFTSEKPDQILKKTSEEQNQTKTQPSNKTDVQLEIESSAIDTIKNVFK